MGIFFVQVVVLGLLQGVAELFPISSLGHTVILPGLLGWGNLTTNESFLPIVVTLHLGTAVALLAFYWRDWVDLVRAFFKTALSGRLDADPHGKTIWLVIVGTIPVGLIGLILQKPIQNMFFAAKWPVLPAAFLCLNGAVLLVGERLRQHSEPTGVDRFKQEQAFAKVDDLSFAQAFFIGLAQALALIPGISRSGVTMVAGMRAQLSHEEAIRFAFLLATPVIAAAALLEVPKLFSAGTQVLTAALAGGVVAALAAFLSVRFLTRYFQVGRLTPFAYYCLAVGFLSFAFFSALSLNVFTLPW
ncbi:MAG TPA: undecaprenyl-diphosphate phosphatase [Ktedonobacterales bacterium]|nr:undecaprenyl-diphosphate phosphatase [Ktedonobacterales bacterium]